MKPEDNHTLTRTDAGTPMGALFRRYWLPALVAAELPDPDCPPVRLPLLGEKLLAFRDTSGRVGIVAETCPHRRASLYFGRSESCGIRCAYHGWLFDADGRCLDIPSEGEGSRVKERIRLSAYPAIERAGVIWVYMGPPEQQPPPPRLEWATLPAGQVYASRRLQECNWLQVMEGGLDSSHLSWLHQGSLMSDPILGIGGVREDRRILEVMAADRSPRFQAIDSPAGLVLGARRSAGPGQYYWRITQYILPCFNIIAPFGDQLLNAQAWVPMDDHNCWSWAVNYHMTAPLSATEREFMRRGAGLHVEFVPGTFQGTASRANDYGRDVAAQRAGTSMTGIPNFAMQDTAVQESQGRIADRSLEQLVSSDYGIVRARRALLQAARANAEGRPLPALDPATQAVRAGSIFAAEAELERVPLDTLAPFIPQERTPLAR